MNRSEWKWLLVATAAILLLTSLPVAAGYIFEPEDRVFGGAVYDRRDYSVHLATMQRGASGEWSYQFMYSTEPGGEAYLKLSYILMGQLAGVIGLDLGLAYQLFRLIGGAGALIGTYLYMAMGTSSIALRRTGYLLAATASGVGWLLLILGWVPDAQVSPIDFWLIDFYLFYSIATFPHFSIMIVLILAMAIGYLQFLQSKKIGYWLLAAGSGLIMLPLQTFTIALGDLAVLGAIFGNWRTKGAVRARDLGPFAILVALQLPLLIFYQSLVSANPLWSEFVSQNVVLAPSPIYFLLGVGVVAPFAVWGAWIAYKRRISVGVQSAFWTIGALVLSLAPSLIQRRFTLVVMVPLSLLAAIGLGFGFLPLLRRAWPAWVRARRGLILAMVIVAALPSTLYLATGGALFASMTPNELYDPAAIHEGIAWLSGAAEESDAVLTSEETGLLIPAFAGLRTYIGHPMETIGYEMKQEQVAQFFSVGEMTTSERVELLRDCSCSWVLVGPYEAADPGLELPETLILKYDREGVRIYQFQEDTSS